VEGEPLAPKDAKDLIQQIIAEHSVIFTKHARSEMEKDDLADIDVKNVLRAGLMLGPAEMERGTWRYRVGTPRIVVVIAFQSETELRIVTAWRTKP
jgi:hypothetical protein